MAEMLEGFGGTAEQASKAVALMVESKPPKAAVAKARR